MSEDNVLTKEDLEHIAKAAGVKLTPENRDGIIFNLQDLRAEIIQKLSDFTNEPIAQLKVVGRCVHN